MAELFGRMRTDARGALACRSTTGLAHMLVWPDTLERAIALLNALCHAAERAGYEVSFREKQYPRAALVVDRERIPFSIIEQFKRPSRLLSDEEWSALDPYHRAIGL